jgi:thiamine pyrophosphate-dependent acetolactate synthase large subunit-like protein
MEIETAVRSGLPLLIFVINNNGIYFGLDKEAYQEVKPLPTTALTPDTRYDKIGEAWLNSFRILTLYRRAEVEDFSSPLPPS